MKYNPSFSHHILNKSSKDRYYNKESGIIDYLKFGKRQP